MIQTIPARNRNSPRPLVSSDATPAGGTRSRGRLPLPVFFYLLTAVLPIMFNVGPLNMSTMRLLLIVTFIPTMYGTFSGRYGPVLLTDKVFVFYIIWAAVAMVINTPTRAIEFAGSFTVEFLGGYFLARAYVRTATDFLALCRWFCLLVILSIPFAIIESTSGNPILLELLRKIPGIDTFAKVYADPRWGLTRVQFTFAHPIHYGLFCSIGFSLSLIALKGSSSTFFRLLAVCGSLVGVFLSLSSGAYMSITMQLSLIIWALIFYKRHDRWKLLLAAFIIWYVVVAALASHNPILVFVTYASFSSSNAYWRALIFEYGMNNVWANPIFGLGLNQWERPSFMVSGSMDNFWLLEAVRYGIPGFLFLTTGYFVALWKIGYRDFDSNKVLWNIRRGWMFTFLGLTITLCTVAIWSSLYSFTFFMFGSGMWMLNVKVKQDGQQGVALIADQSSHLERNSSATDGSGSVPGFTRFPQKSKT